MKYIKIVVGLVYVNYGYILVVVKEVMDVGVDYVYLDVVDMYDLKNM